MLSTISIYNAISEAIENQTKIPVYSNEVIEGFVAPCFFLKISEREVQDVGISVMKRTVDVSLNYFPPAEGKRVRDELDANLMAAFLHKLFHLNIKVDDRYLIITNRRHDFGGENFDLLIFSFDMTFFDDFKIEKEQQPKPIEQINIKTKSLN